MGYQNVKVEREREGRNNRVLPLPEQGPLRRYALQGEQQEARRHPPSSQEQQNAGPEQHQIVVPGDGRGQQRRRDERPQTSLWAVPDLRGGEDNYPDPYQLCDGDHPRQRRDGPGELVIREQPGRSGGERGVVPVRAER